MGDDLDDDGYPTDEALARIEAWPSTDCAGALDYVKSLWHWEDWASHELRSTEAEVVHAEPEDHFLRLATGGWSGNESLVGALNANVLLFAFTWHLSARGGLHIFKYPDVNPPAGPRGSQA